MFKSLIDTILCYKDFKLFDGTKLLKECFFDEESLFAIGCTFDNELLFNLGRRSVERAFENKASINGAINVGVIRQPMKEGAQKMLSEDAHVVFSLAKSFCEGANHKVIARGILGGESEFISREFDSRAFFEVYMRPFLRLARSFIGVVIPAGLLSGKPVYMNRQFIELVKKSVDPSALIINSFLSITDPIALVKSGAGLILPAVKKDYMILKQAYDDGVITSNELEELAFRIRQFTENSKPPATPMFRHYDEQKVLSEKSIVLLENNGVLPLRTLGECSVLGSEIVNGISYEFVSLSDEADKTTAIIFATAKNGALEKSAIVNIAKAKKDKKEVVLILVCPRPCVLPDNLAADAIIFVPNVYSHTADALCKILKGELSPSGKLSVTWAKKESDYPACVNPRFYMQDMFVYESVYNGYKYFDAFSAKYRYPFGHGLSYCEFSISNQKVTKFDEFTSLDFDLANLSDSSGESVVFVFDNYTAKEVFGLKKRLVGFIRVKLNANEKKRVHIHLENDEFTIYNESEKTELFLGSKHELSLAFSAQKNECQVELKFKKSEPDFSWCSIKKYPSFYNKHEFYPNALEVETLMGVKLYAPHHGYDQHVLIPNEPRDFKLIKKTQKLLNKSFSEIAFSELKNMPTGILEHYRTKI